MNLGPSRAGIPSRLRAAALATTLACGLGAGLGPTAPATASACTGNPNQVLSLQAEMGIPGLFAAPVRTPRGIAVFGHGYRNSSAAWQQHLIDTANHGLLAVAPDYTGLGPAPDYRGWPAQAGANDLVAAAQHFVVLCGDNVQKVYLMGVSMGGNMTGLALAQGAVRPNNHLPLFSYWIDVEGVTNVIETWAAATAVGPGNAYAAGASADIEAETGGTPVTALSAYLARDVVVRSTDVAGSKVTGIAVIHSIEDGLVPVDQSVEMTALLRQECKKVDLFGVLRRTSDRDPGHDQTTILSDISPVLGDMDPFSGHAWEGSSTHIVMKTAMNELFTLADGVDQPDNDNFIVDSGLGTVEPLALPHTFNPIPGACFSPTEGVFGAPARHGSVAPDGAAGTSAVRAGTLAGNGAARALAGALTDAIAARPVRHIGPRAL